MSNHSQPSSGRGVAILGMVVTFLGGYVLGSMSQGSSAREEAEKVTRVFVPVESSPTRGPADAPVTIVEFADFQCGYCSKSVELQHRIARDYGDRVRWVFKHLPLSFHKRARAAAVAAGAAARQGRFWEFHDLLFMQQKKMSDEDFVAHARTLGLDEARFKQEYQAAELEQQVKADEALAKQLKVEGTPNFFINGRQIIGTMSFKRLEKLVRQELRRAQTLLESGTARSDLYRKLSDSPAKPAKPGAAKPETPPVSVRGLPGAPPAARL